MATQNSTAASDFGDRRVLVDHDEVTAPMQGGTAYWGQSANGPIQIAVSRATSDAAVAHLAQRHGIDAGELRVFCSQSKPGNTMVATPIYTEHLFDTAPLQ